MAESLFESFRTAAIDSPWLAAIAVLLVVNAMVRALRKLIHGRHRPDLQRRFSASQHVIILSRAGHRCEHTSLLFGRCDETAGLHADHVHPHSRGGATVVENGQALCPRHNKQKAARVPWNWELTRLARRRQAYFPTGAETAVVRRPRTNSR